VKAKEAFIGTEYEKGTLPRLLFVSLDPDRSDSNPRQRTVKYVREKFIRIKVRLYLPLSFQTKVIAPSHPKI
jgi:hypothetical protein